jgi:fructose-1,6-bisphosphatase/sedoheptulose 1,7-bisphosphatase-like protein
MGRPTPVAAVSAVEVAAAAPHLATLDPRDDPATAALTTALAAAARDAAATGARLRGGADREERKRQVDGAATSAAEAVFAAAGTAIDVVAGEGQRDASPGAAVGQRLGAQADARFEGIFDYVDGTALVADGLPGALALGALGRGLRVVPDLQALAVVGPAGLLGEIDVMAHPEESVARWLDVVARGLGRSTGDLTIATHSTTSGRSHRALIERMTATGAHVIVPEPVTIEPPYLLSAAGLAEPRVDAFVGVIGLSEIAYAALLLDLVLPDHGIVFRLASIAGARAAQVDHLGGHFAFTAQELETYAAHGWDVGVAHTSEEVVPSGCGHSAALFAVTENELLGLRAPAVEADTVAVDGLVFGRGAQAARVQVTFADQPSAVA